MESVKFVVIAALVVTALAVAGCGGDSDSGGETTSAGASTATEGTTSSDQQAEATTGGSEGSDSAGKRKSGGGPKSGDGGGGGSKAGDSRGGGSKSGGKAVKIVDFDYEPPDLTVAAGTKIRFKNEDATPHTATASDDPDVFDTGSIAGGKSATVKLDKPGKYPYFCTIHPFMKASLTVK